APDLERHALHGRERAVALGNGMNADHRPFSTAAQHNRDLGGRSARYTPPVSALPLACLGLALAQDPAVVEHEPALVDRIVAVVGDRLVLASEVAIENEIGARNVYTLAALAERRKDASRWLVDMAIVRALAGDVRVYEPTRQDVADALERFAESFGDAASYRRFLDSAGLSQERLQ